jgi:hypothetical protein
MDTGILISEETHQMHDEMMIAQYPNLVKALKLARDFIDPDKSPPQGFTNRDLVKFLDAVLEVSVTVGLPEANKTPIKQRVSMLQIEMLDFNRMGLTIGQRQSRSQSGVAIPPRYPPNE